MTIEISKTYFVDSNGSLKTETDLLFAHKAFVDSTAAKAQRETLSGVLSIMAAKKEEVEADDTDEDDEDMEVDEKDEWDEENEEEEWDPDFDEFDIPKSTGKGASSKGSDEDDLKFDEDLNEFDDLFGEGGDDFDDDDDF